MFFCDCTACGWEGPPADTAELAAAAGGEHVTLAHAAALAQGNVSYLRIWSYQQVVIGLGNLPQFPGILPDDKPPALGDKPKPPDTAEAKKPHEGRKGR